MGSLFIIVSSLLVCMALSMETIEKQFNLNDCYEPGTIFEENEKNLGFCPCKYGYFGPRCFEIFSCVIGRLSTENCSKEFNNDYDLRWRCASSGKEIVQICKCPDGFRGETCEFILENTLSMYLKTISQSQKFFEVIYNKSDSFFNILGMAICNALWKHRHQIIFVLLLLISSLAFKIFIKNKVNQAANPKILLNHWQFHETKNMIPLDMESQEREYKSSSYKFQFEEDSSSRITEFSEISEMPGSDEIVSIENEKQMFCRPHLHI